MGQQVSKLSTQSSKLKKLAFIVGIIYASMVFKKMYRKSKKYPNGPLSLPLLGNTIGFALNTEKFFVKQSKYGEISFFELGNSYGCSINSIRLIKELFKNKNAINRLPQYGMIKLDVIGLTDTNWKNRRKIIMKSFIASLDTKYILKSQQYSTVKSVFPNIDKCIKNNELYYPRKDLTFAAFNTIYNNSTGEVASIDSELFKNMCKLVQDWFVLYQEVLPAFLFPKLKPIMSKFGKLSVFNKCELEWLKMADKIIEIRKNYVQNHMNIETNYIDNILDDLNTTQKGYKNPYHLQCDIATMFLAGMDTTMVTSEWILYYLGKHTDIQQKIFNELRHVYNQNNIYGIDNPHESSYYFFGIKWINQCHTYKSFIWECLRLCDVTDFGLSHYTSKNINIKLKNGEEYIIPKNTVLFPNLNYVRHDMNADETWIKPANEFNLNNFLNKNGKFKMNESAILFSTGPRNCLGQSLAMKHLYGIIAHIILNYNIDLQDPNIKPKVNPGLSKKMTPIPLIMSKRSW